MDYSLNELKLNDCGTICGIDTDDTTRERLESLGIIPGIQISPVFETPLRSPIVYQCLNTMIALREDISSKIRIRLGGQNE